MAKAKEEAKQTAEEADKLSRIKDAAKSAERFASEIGASLDNLRAIQGETSLSDIMGSKEAVEDLDAVSHMADKLQTKLDTFTDAAEDSGKRLQALSDAGTLLDDLGLGDSKSVDELEGILDQLSAVFSQLDDNGANLSPIEDGLLHDLRDYARELYFAALEGEELADRTERLAALSGDFAEAMNNVSGETSKATQEAKRLSTQLEEVKKQQDSLTKAAKDDENDRFKNRREAYEAEFKILEARAEGNTQLEMQLTLQREALRLQERLGLSEDAALEKARERAELEGQIANHLNRQSFLKELEKDADNRDEQRTPNEIDAIRKGFAENVNRAKELGIPLEKVLDTLPDDLRDLAEAAKEAGLDLETAFDVASKEADQQGGRRNRFNQGGARTYNQEESEARRQDRVSDAQLKAEREREEFFERARHDRPDFAPEGMDGVADAINDSLIGRENFPGIDWIKGEERDELNKKVQEMKGNEGKGIQAKLKELKPEMELLGKIADNTGATAKSAGAVERVLDERLPAKAT